MLEWSGLVMKGTTVPVGLGRLGALEELSLLENQHMFDVPEGLQGLRERLGSTCSIFRLEPHIRAIFRDNFHNSGECVELWRHLLTYV